MKNLLITGFVLASILKPVKGRAQQPDLLQQQVPDKPMLFGQLAAKTPCATAPFSNIFRLRLNDKVSLPMADGFTFTGQVISVVRQNPYVTSINIRSINYPGAMLNLSQISEPGKAVVYQGRIVSRDASDVITIEREGGQYILHRQWQKYFRTE